MTGNYTLSTFLRQTPNHILKQYFHEKSLLKNIDFDSLKKTEYEPILKALLIMEERDNIEKEFRIIHPFCNAWGSKILIEVLRNKGRIKDDENPFDGMVNSYERAIWFYQKHKDLFKDANDYAYMDSHHRWKRYGIGEGRKPDTTEKTKTLLVEEIGKQHERYGCGKRRTAEIHVRQKPLRYCYFIYIQGYIDTEDELDENNQFYLRTKRPLIETVFVYHPDTGMFETSVKGTEQEIKKVQTLFCRHIFKLPTLPPDNKMQFKLGRLWEEIDYSLDEEDGIEEVELKSVKLKDGNGIRITIEGGRDCANGQVQKVMFDKFKGKEKDGKHPEILRAEYQLNLNEENPYGKKTHRFYLTSSNDHNIGDNPIDYVVRKYLGKWELEYGDVSQKISTDGKLQEAAAV